MKKYDLEHHYLDASVMNYLKSRTEYPYYDEKCGLRASERLPLFMFAVSTTTAKKSPNL